MKRLKFFKKCIIFTLFLVYFTQPVLAETIFEDQGIPKQSYGLTFAEFDRMKCYNGSRIDNEKLLDPPYFNSENYPNFTRFLKEELEDLVIKEKTSWEFTNYTIYGRGNERDLFFSVFTENGDAYEFRTKGAYWWAMSRDIQGFDIFNSESYGQISRNYTTTHQIFESILNRVERALRDFLRRDREIKVSCHLDSPEERQNLLHLVNVYLPNTYSPEVGCEYSEGGLYANCSNSKIYRSINKSLNFWEFKDSANQITYKSGNNFIFLDQSDIRLNEGEKWPNNLGFMVVISEGDFFRSYRSGKTVFVDSYYGHLNYIQTLDEVYRKTLKLKSINSLMKEKVEEVNKKNQNLSDILKSSDELKVKQEKLNLSDSSFDTSTFIAENRNLLGEYEDYYENADTLRMSIRNRYFGIYYQDITQEYFEDLNREIQNLKSNLDSLESRNDVYSDNLRNSLIAVQSQIDSLNIQKSSNLSLIIILLVTIMALFVTLSMNVLVYVSDKHSMSKTKSDRDKLLWFLIFLAISLFILLGVIEDNGLNPKWIILGTLILFGILIVGFWRISDFLLKKEKLDSKGP